MTAPERSNYLPALAARIRAEHEATSAALRSSVAHGIAAGELLMEAKASVPHGQWLLWLKEHCAISERTAQLYMRLAKNREAVEANTQPIADLTLNEAAAVLMLSSDVRKLFQMAKATHGLEGDELIGFFAENRIATLSGNIFSAPEPTDREWVEWNIYVLYLARRQGWSVEAARLHAGWVQSRGTLLADWMKPDPIRDVWMKSIPQATLDDWNLFLEANQNRSLDDVQAELKELEEQEARRPKREPLRRRGRGQHTAMVMA